MARQFPSTKFTNPIYVGDELLEPLATQSAIEDIAGAGTAEAPEVAAKVNAILAALRAANVIKS